MHLTINRSIRTTALFAPASLLVVLGAACGDADSAAPTTAAIADRADWCHVVADVNTMFAALDTSSADFAAEKAGYATIQGKIALLTAATPTVVDADAAFGVERLLDWATVVTETVINASSSDVAADRLYGEDSELRQQWAALDDSGPSWIKANCGVDIDA